MKWFPENYLNAITVLLIIAVTVLSLFVFPLESKGGTELYFSKDPKKMVENTGMFSFTAHNRGMKPHFYEYAVEVDSKIIANDAIRLEPGEKQVFNISLQRGREVEVFLGNLSIKFWNE